MMTAATGVSVAMGATTGGSVATTGGSVATTGGSVAATGGSVASAPAAPGRSVAGAQAASIRDNTTVTEMNFRIVEWFFVFI
jgi:hypothetical protein